MTQNYFKGLNGIRAFAALAILFFHLNGQVGTPYVEFFKWWNVGVTVFFCLSGFLITYLLLIEKEKTETISIKNFYVRRILRIWPLYFFYLIAAVVYLYVSKTPDSNLNMLWLYVFFAANLPFLLGNSIPFIGHYWSLATEEQFYAFWPFLIMKGKSVIKSLLFFLTSWTILKLICRILDIKYDLPWLTSLFQTLGFDNMAIGGIGAYLYLNYRGFVTKYVFSVFVQLICLLSFGLMFISKFHFVSVIDNQLVSIMTVILILNTSTNPRTIFKLENPILNFLGKISFGIYVYHQLIIHFVLEKGSVLFRGIKGLPYVFLVYSLALMCTLIISYLSYNLLEKRFLKLKTKYSI